MASYNAISDVPSIANSWLLTDVPKKDWGFKGFVVSDYGSVFGIKEKQITQALYVGLIRM
jgi:beta-glucosidase